MSENARSGFCREVIRYVAADQRTRPPALDASLDRREEPGDDVSDLLVTSDPRKRVRCKSFDARL